MFLPSRPCLSPSDPLELDSKELTKLEAPLLLIPNMRRSAVSPLLRRAPAAVRPLTRSLATVVSAPAPVSTRKTTHGGLRDQDRIFSNAYMKHDHGLKGAMVRPSASRIEICGGERGLPRSVPPCLPRVAVAGRARAPRWARRWHRFCIDLPAGRRLSPPRARAPLTPLRRNVVTGTERRTSSTRETAGSLTRSRTLGSVAEVELDSRRASSGAWPAAAVGTADQNSRSFMNKPGWQEDKRPRYLVVNADEGEPGTWYVAVPLPRPIVDLRID